MSLGCKANARNQLYEGTVDTELEDRHKREESLLKRRRETVAPNIDVVDLQNLSAIRNALASDDIEAKLPAFVQLQKMLSIVNNPPIDAVIQSGVVPLLVDLLRNKDLPEVIKRCNWKKYDDMTLLQFEAAWALNNIVSGTSEHIKVVIDCGALPIFVELLSSWEDNIIEQAALALGNIAGESTAYRDFAIAHGALNLLLGRFNEYASISFIKFAAWTFSIFCRDKPQPQFDKDHYRDGTKGVFSAMLWLLCSPYDDVWADACWSLSYLSDGSNSYIQAIIDAGICPKLVKLLSHASPYVVIPALLTLGNIVAGDDVQTQVVIDNQALPRILNLLTVEHTDRDIVREACWTISNIAAGTKKQIQAVIDAKIFPPLLWLLSTAEFSIRKQTARAVTNAISGGSDEQIKYLVIQGCIRPLCDLLDCQDPRIITVCLEGLENILTAGEAKKIAGVTDVNIYVSQIDDAGGLEKIENLQSHESTEIYEKAAQIVVNYLA